MLLVSVLSLVTLSFVGCTSAALYFDDWCLVTSNLRGVPSDKQCFAWLFFGRELFVGLVFVAGHFVLASSVSGFFVLDSFALGFTSDPVPAKMALVSVRFCLASSARQNSSWRSLVLKKRRCFGSFSTRLVRNCLKICLW
uniref:Secreted protein n=1 Tax=Ixodes ricinus TaxID=34613 RepID=A0A6B0UT33_IXORI